MIWGGWQPCLELEHLKNLRFHYKIIDSVVFKGVSKILLCDWN